MRLLVLFIIIKKFSNKISIFTPNDDFIWADLDLMCADFNFI